MIITPTQVFLDGTDRFEPGQSYEVDQLRGAYFVSHGWATSPSLPSDWGEGLTVVTPPAEPVTLAPQDTVSGQSSGPA